MNTCKTCAYWNFKLGGLSSGKEWGECTNPKVIEATRVSLRHVGLGEFVESTEQYAKLSDEVDKYARIQFEEATFGCVYHKDEE